MPKTIRKDDEHQMADASYADILRALGRFLDEQGARDVEIVEHPTFVAVSWTGNSKPGTRSYNELGLRHLQDQAHAMRGRQDTAPGGELSELLRTLGQELDRGDFDLSRIQEDDRGFTVAGTFARRYSSKHFLKSELRALSAARRAGRAAPQPQRRGWRFW